MISRPRLAAVLIFVLVALAGCSQNPSESGDGSVPGRDEPATGSSADAQNKEGERPEGAGPATTREKFLPVLTQAHAGVSWPSAYTMTPDDLWGFMASGAADTSYSQSDATDMVTIWNTCAWILQLIDDTKAGRSIDKDVAQLTKLGEGPAASFVGRIVSDAKLGELGTARQFVTANGCEKGFGD
ncbi:hypothetical protein [Plantactinospora soyae]|uniref:Lipoprotein n=1 Tax=Plantactinospora soyae TaxID=1544732 RepID=A0A927M7J4_9ACTN|nr:hypothetical protein [Plantactinospora soyae]MBE1489429.1 hypothetical protein [Plantactinospora soyae]